MPQKIPFSASSGRTNSRDALWVMTPGTGNSPKWCIVRYKSHPPTPPPLPTPPVPLIQKIITRLREAGRGKNTTKHRRKRQFFPRAVDLCSNYTEHGTPPALSFKTVLPPPPTSFPQDLYINKPKSSSPIRYKAEGMANGKRFNRKQIFTWNFKFCHFSFNSHLPMTNHETESQSAVHLEYSTFPGDVFPNVTHVGSVSRRYLIIFAEHSACFVFPASCVI